MSGKSTYLRQVVLLTIMAQIGCFVPAQFAQFRITDRIFSRVCNKDSIETNSSSFCVEMQEIALILNNLGQSSLAIIDELGRGTSVEEGTAICWAICEALLNSSCFVFLATHFMQMTSLADVHPCVENYHFLTRIDSNQVEYTHQLVRGKMEIVRLDDASENDMETSDTNVVHYGLELAARTTFPANIIEKAKQMCDSVGEPGDQSIVTLNQLDLICNQTIIKLKKLAKLQLGHEELKQELSNIRNAFLDESKLLPEVKEAENINDITKTTANQSNIDPPDVTNEDDDTGMITVENFIENALNQRSNMDDEAKILSVAVNTGNNNSTDQSGTKSDKNENISDKSENISDKNENISVNDNISDINENISGVVAFEDEQVVCQNVKNMEISQTASASCATEEKAGKLSVFHVVEIDEGGETSDKTDVEEELVKQDSSQKDTNHNVVNMEIEF